MLFKPKTALIGDQFGFDDHIEDNVVLHAKGHVLAMFEIDGVHPDTATTDEVVRWFDQLHGALKNIAHDDVELTSYQCHGNADPSCYRDGPHTSEFVRALSKSYKATLLGMTLYQNRFFLAVSILAPSATNQNFLEFFADTAADPRAAILARAKRLNSICLLLQSLLTGYNIRRLGIAIRGNVPCSEIAEAVVLALTGKWRQIPLTTGLLGHNMFSETIRFTPNYNPTRIEFHGPGNPRYAEIYAYKDPPAATWPGQFYALMQASYTCTLMQSFRFLSTASSVTVLGRKQNTMIMAGDKAYSQIGDLVKAPNALMNREWVLGDHSLLFIAFADNYRAMDTVGNAAHRDLASCGIEAARVTKALRATYQSLAPCNGEWRIRPGFIRSDNFLAFTPFFGWPTGPLNGMWGGPIATFRSMGGTPVYFHYQHAGNILVTGVPGSGKTFWTSYLIAMTAGRARVVALDHKRGWQFLLNAMKGDYAVWGAGEPHCAPLKALSNTPRNVELLTLLFRGCIGKVMTEEENRRLSLGLRIIMQMPAHERSVGELLSFFSAIAEGAGRRLERWVLGNELGWALDAPIDTVSFGALSGIDLTMLMLNPQVRGPVMSYLFHRIEQMLDGTPFLLTIDEGWQVFKDPAFCDNVEKQIRTIRSKGGIVIFITQSLGEVIESKITRVLVEMCPTRICLANPAGRHDDYVNELKLTEGQFEAFKTIDSGEGKFLLVQPDRSIVAQLPLHDMKEFVPVLSATEFALQRADKIAHEEVTS